MYTYARIALRRPRTHPTSSLVGPNSHTEEPALLVQASTTYDRLRNGGDLGMRFRMHRISYCTLIVFRHGFCPDQ